MFVILSPFYIAIDCIIDKLFNPAIITKMPKITDFSSPQKLYLKLSHIIVEFPLIGITDIYHRL